MTQGALGAPRTAADVFGSGNVVGVYPSTRSVGIGITTQERSNEKNNVQFPFRME